MCRLRFLKIVVNLGAAGAVIKDFNILSSLMGSLCVSLTSPATFEHLEFNIHIDDHVISFDKEQYYENIRHADAWSHLDSITSQPTGSRLQRVDISIDHIFHYLDYDDYMLGRSRQPDGDETKKAVLDGLPLLRTKGILFVKAGVTWGL